MAVEIPGPHGLPIIGNALDVDSKNTWLSFRKLAERYGEIYKIKALGKDIVFVCSVALCDEICDESRFHKAVQGPVEEIHFSLHDSPLSDFSDESSSGTAHSVVIPSLAPEYMQNYFHDLIYVAKEFTSNLRNLNTRQPRNIHDYLAREALESCTLALYGKKLGNMSNPKHAMLHAMEVATSEALLRPNRPGILHRLVYQHKFEKSTDVMRKYACDLIQYRRDHPELSRRKDVLNALINAKDPGTTKPLDEEYIIDQVITLAMTLTKSPALLATTIFYLLHNRHCIDKAREEISIVLGDEELELHHLSQLKYIDGILKESTRLAAPTPGFNVQPIPNPTKTSVSLANGKYEIAQDQTVIAVLAAINRDPAVYENAECFQPERMMGESFDALPRTAKQVFGGGGDGRECVGRDFAWTWCMVVLVQMLRDLDLRLVDDSYILRQEGWFCLRPVGFEVYARGRRRT